MIYSGIGSRQRPEDVLERMGEISWLLGSLGYTLRSGGADGADSAFEDALWDSEVWDCPMWDMEIYLPWSRFVGAGGKIKSRKLPYYMDLDGSFPSFINIKKAIEEVWNLWTELLAEAPISLGCDSTGPLVVRGRRFVIKK